MSDDQRGEFRVQHEDDGDDATQRVETALRGLRFGTVTAVVRRVRKTGIVLAGLVFAFPFIARAGDYRPQRGPTIDERIEKLEREIEELKRERQEERDAGAKETASKDAVSREDVDNAIDTALKKQKVLAGWQDGFFLQSPSGDFKLKLRGYAQADARFFPFDEGDTGNDSFFLRRARPIFEGMRAGKFKEPVSLERLQSGTVLTFIERAI